MGKSLASLGLMAALMAIAVSSWGTRTRSREQEVPPAIRVGPDVPSDIPGGARDASLQSAALFAWQEFIALNWPAKSGVRDTPDPSLKFGAPTPGPLVWHTYRSKIEVFPGSNSASSPPHGYTRGGAPNYGYDDPPLYAYNAHAVGSSDGQVQPCAGQAPAAKPAWINLDEVSQIGLDSMCAGTVPAAATSTNSSTQLIRFTAKANRTEYAYVASNAYWYHGEPLTTALSNFKDAVKSGAFPPRSPYISLPPGTIETKAAFRPLTPEEVRSNRFYSTRVRYYEQEAGGRPCYREDTWGLIALHIIQKTPSAPAFVFATFEQADNLLTTRDGKGVPVEDADGNVINATATATSPALIYADSPVSPRVAVSPPKAPFCDTTGQPELFYRNSENPGVPSGGNICVNRRDHAIPPPIIAANRAAHEAIAAYSAANGVVNSPWAYYKLVNVQAYPFNVTDIVDDPNSPRGASTFYQANIVVESNYTLQNFSGRLDSNGAPTNYTYPAGVLYQQNTRVLKGDGSLNRSYDMGGCMGCHGTAQSRGGDFSFILQLPPSRSPESPDLANAQELKDRYRPIVDGGRAK